MAKDDDLEEEIKKQFLEGKISRKEAVKRLRYEGGYRIGKGKELLDEWEYKELLDEWEKEESKRQGGGAKSWEGKKKELEDAKLILDEIDRREEKERKREEEEKEKGKKTEKKESKKTEEEDKKEEGGGEGEGVEDWKEEERKKRIWEEKKELQKIAERIQEKIEIIRDKEVAKRYQDNLDEIKKEYRIEKRSSFDSGSFLIKEGDIQTCKELLDSLEKDVDKIKFSPALPNIPLGKKFSPAPPKVGYDEVLQEFEKFKKGAKKKAVGEEPGGAEREGAGREGGTGQHPGKDKRGGSDLEKKREKWKGIYEGVGGEEKEEAGDNDLEEEIKKQFLEGKISRKEAVKRLRYEGGYRIDKGKELLDEWEKEKSEQQGGGIGRDEREGGEGGGEEFKNAGIDEIRDETEEEREKRIKEEEHHFQGPSKEKETKGIFRKLFGKSEPPPKKVKKETEEIKKAEKRIKEPVKRAGGKPYHAYLPHDIGEWMGFAALFIGLFSVVTGFPFGWFFGLPLLIIGLIFLPWGKMEFVHQAGLIMIIVGIVILYLHLHLGVGIAIVILGFFLMIGDKIATHKTLGKLGPLAQIFKMVLTVSLLVAIVPSFLKWAGIEVEFWNLTLYTGLNTAVLYILWHMSGGKNLKEIKKEFFEEELKHAKKENEEEKKEDKEETEEPGEGNGEKNKKIKCPKCGKEVDHLVTGFGVCEECLAGDYGVEREEES